MKHSTPLWVRPILLASVLFLSQLAVRPEPSGMAAEVFAKFAYALM